MNSKKSCAHECMVCKNADEALMSFHVVKEMMFGMGDIFEYMRCKECGLLQICEIPEDMSKYYPQNGYYSFQNDDNVISKLKKYARIQAYKNYLLGKRSPVGLFRNALRPLSTSIVLNLLRELPSDGILDVGCGGGVLLDELAACGYHDLSGVDLFIDHIITTKHR